MQGTESITVQKTNLDRSIADGPEPVVLGSQAHGFATQGLAKIDCPSLPFDLSVGADPSYRRPGLVLWGIHAPGIGAYRRSVPASWGLLTQGFMGSFLVIVGTKALEGPLLPAPGGLGWAGGLRLQRTVQPLQPAVLFRMPRLDALWDDSQLDPPHCQGRQASQAYAGKRRAVVGANSPRETILLEGPLQHRAYLGASGLAQPVASQEISGRGVLHGKGIDPHPIPGAKPALEVDAPQVVGLLRLDKGLALGRRPAASLAPAHQPSPVLQPSYQLLRAPGWMRLPRRNQTLCHRPLRLVRMLMRRPAQVSQPIPTPNLKAMDPFVAGLPADLEGLAQFQESFSPALPSLYEPDLLRFGVRTFPRHHFPPHRHFSFLPGKCYPCSRFLCYQSTRFVPSNSPPFEGERTYPFPLEGLTGVGKCLNWYKNT